MAERLERFNFNHSDVGAAKSIQTPPTAYIGYHLEVNLNGRTHGSLDVDLANVLPLLLEQTSQEVSSQLGVDDNLLGVHFDISDSNVEAHDLLHLELDGRLDFINLLLHIFTTRQKSGELTRLGETRTQKTRDLLDEVIGSDEEIITLGEFLDQLFVFVELLQVLDTHVVDADAIGLLTVGSVTEHAALEFRAGNGGELEGSRETLVTNGVVVLERDLSFNRLGEVTLLALLVDTVDLAILAVGELENVLDGLFQNLRVELGHFVE